MKHIYLLKLTLMLYPLSSQAYSNLSPYSYCGGNPVKCIDPAGEDIAVLNYKGRHLAMLIQNEDGKWQYYSVNGNNVYSCGSHKGGREFNDVAVGSWDSPQEFLDSPYNVRDDDSKDDKNKNHYGFEQGYQIPTTPAQDKIMRNSFKNTAKTTYNIINNNCATAVQKAMVDAGIPVSEPIWEPYYIPVSTPFGIVDVVNSFNIKYELKMLPKTAYESIIKYNPSGKFIHKK